MEFFDMDQATHRLTTSPQIWVYFVTAAATTILTVALYYVMAGFPKIRWKGHVDVATSYKHVPYSLQRGDTDIEMCSKTPGDALKD
jgi:hypothetical protein